MLYRFNKYAGKASTVLWSKWTSGLESKMIPGQTDQSSTINFARSVWGCSSSCRAGGGVLPNSQYGPMSPKLKAKQVHFQVDNGLPVHLKGGPFDKFLYYFTLGLSVFCIGQVFYFVGTHSFPKKHH